MSIKTRLNKLEQAHGAQDKAILVIYSEEGIVTQADSAPELVGKTLDQVSEIYAARDDTILLTVVYVPANGRD